LPSPLDRLAEFQHPEYGKIVAQLGHLGEPKLEQFAVSPDCKLVAGSRDNGTIDLWDGATGKKLFSPGAHKAVIAMAFSPSNAKLLVTSSSDKTIKLWNLNTKDDIRTWQVPVPTYFAISPDGKTLATAGWDCPNVMLWDVDTGKQKPPIQRAGKLQPFFSPDGRTLAWTAENAPLTLWNLAANKEQVIAGLPKAISLAFAPDGQTLATTEWDGPIQLWDLAKGKQLKTLGKPGDQVVGFAVDEKRLLVKRGGQGCYLLEVASGKELWQGGWHSNAFALAADGRHLIIGDRGVGYILRIPK